MPSLEMLARALPEDVVQNGGGVSGFLYFEEVGLEEPRFRFIADLINAEIGDIFGQISIPLVVREVP